MRFLPGFYDVFDDMFDDGWMSPSTNAMQCDIEEVDTVKAYQDLLFRPNQSLPTNREHRVTLREEKQTVTWQMIVMVCCAILVMGWSIFNFVRRNKKNNG